MSTQIQLRNDTNNNWKNANPILAVGEMGVNTTNEQFKIGDGVTAWNDLAYGGLQGQPGITGATGTAATIAVGTTTVTAAGEPAYVQNVGSSSDAVFNFDIPTGPQGSTGATGPMGAGIEIQGAVPNQASLPYGASEGQLYIAADTGDGWVSNGNNTWTNIGSIEAEPLLPFGEPNDTLCGKTAG